MSCLCLDPCCWNYLKFCLKNSSALCFQCACDEANANGSPCPWPWDDAFQIQTARIGVVSQSFPIQHPRREAWSTTLGAKEVPLKPHTLPFPLHICVLDAQPQREGWSHELERRDEEVVNVASLPNLVFLSQQVMATSSTPRRMKTRRAKWLVWWAPWFIPRTPPTAWPSGITCPVRTWAHCGSSCTTKSQRSMISWSGWPSDTKETTGRKGGCSSTSLWNSTRCVVFPGWEGSSFWETGDGHDILEII